MPSLMENVSIVSQAVRTILAALVVTALAAAGWYGYDVVNSRDRSAMELAEAERELGLVRHELQRKEQQISSLQDTVQEQQETIDRLDTALRLLKVDHRLAELTVLDQIVDEQTGQATTLVEFQEVDEQGNEVGQAKQFEIPGDQVYIDSWVVKFDDKYIEQSDLHRSTSLVLFRRLFGENQKPSDGYALDPVGSRPHAYARGGKMSDFEQQIWKDFWSVANDQQRQQELGIRAAHGEAPSIKAEPGKSYRIQLRASGGISVLPSDNAEAVKDRPSA